MTVIAQPALDSRTAMSLSRCRAVLDSHYGPQLAGLILYGSTARGTAGEESDLDLLVLLKGELDYFAELRTVTALLYPIQLDSGHLLSAETTARPGTYPSPRPAKPSRPPRASWRRSNSSSSSAGIG